MAEIKALMSAKIIAAPAVTFVPAARLLSEPSPINWLVRGIIPASSLITLIGAPGSFKSNIAIDIAASVATGVDWHGRPTKGAGNAAFLLVGEGHHGISRRLKAWSIARGNALAHAPLFVSTGGVGLIDPLNAAAVAAEVQKLANSTGTAPQLLVVDTMARCFGPGDENSASDVSAFVANLDTHIRQLFDCAIIVVHHSGLSDNARARGSSALRAAVDVEMVTERSPSTRTVMLKCTKAKDMPEFEPITFEALTVTLPWQGEDGQPETSFVMRPCDPPTDTRTADVARLKAEGKSIRDIAKELKISKSTADRIAQAADRYTKASRGE